MYWVEVMYEVVGEEEEEEDVVTALFRPAGTDPAGCELVVDWVIELDVTREDELDVELDDMIEDVLDVRPDDELEVSFTDEVGTEDAAGGLLRPAGTDTVLLEELETRRTDELDVSEIGAALLLPAGTEAKEPDADDDDCTTNRVELVDNEPELLETI